MKQLETANFMAKGILVASKIVEMGEKRCWKKL